MTLFWVLTPFWVSNAEGLMHKLHAYMSILETAANESQEQHTQYERQPDAGYVA